MLDWIEQCQVMGAEIARTVLSVFFSRATKQSLDKVPKM
jgi:hypothetical protein